MSERAHLSPDGERLVAGGIPTSNIVKIHFHIAAIGYVLNVLQELGRGYGAVEGGGALDSEEL